ncbi:MAG: glycosyltransferase family 1 protein [Candidatus Bathyarchaeia archaeon]
MKVFVDGIIFSRQRVGGISRMWEEYLKRLPHYGVAVKLLIPFYHHNSSLNRLLKQQKQLEILSDYFYWPLRYFGRVRVRSGILEWYLDDSINIFHSTYFTTVFNGRIKKVVTIHDMIPEIFEVRSPNRWVHFLIDMKRRVMENADRIIAISYNTKRDILAIYPWIPEEKISVIYHGVSLPKFDANISYECLAEKYALDVKSGEYFLYIGLRGGYKNFELIIKLLEQDHSSRDWIFLCVGGEKNDLLPEIIAEKGLSRNFRFLRFVPDEELMILYRNAIALIYPSLYEGFGLPVLEAMANECPVICSSTSSLPEVAGEAAIFFDPYSVESLKEGIVELLRRDRNEIIAKGLENVKRFSWERSTKALVDIYASLI